MAALVVTDLLNTMNDGNYSQAQTNVLLSKTKSSEHTVHRDTWEHLKLVFLESYANSFAQTGTSSYVAGKEVDLEACKWKVGGEEEGKKRKKKHTHCNLRLSISLYTAPLYPGPLIF